MNSFESLTFYRGLSLNYDISAPSLHFTRKNRTPRDLPENIHETADAWFKKKFGVSYRSQSLLVTSSEHIAATYAATPNHIGRIIPLGNYCYCWSPIIQDMLELFLNQRPLSSIEEELESAHYKEEDLEAAFKSEHEVMLFCESYICIPINTTLQRHE